MMEGQRRRHWAVGNSAATKHGRQHAAHAPIRTHGHIATRPSHHRHHSRLLGGEGERGGHAAGALQRGCEGERQHSATADRRHGALERMERGR